MKSRSVAREITLITLFQLDRKGQLQSENAIKESDLKTLMLNGVRAISDQARETLEETAKDLSLFHEFFVQMEQEHPDNLETPIDRPSVPVAIPDTKEMGEKIEALMTCADHLAEALRIPELVALSEQADVQRYVLKLLTTTQANLMAIDALIESCTEDWTVKRLSRMDRSILRLATVEMKFIDEVDASTTIDEAVELSKTFGDDNSYKFINGLLGAMADKLAPPESELAAEATLFANIRQN